ncbi:50S ribosomal protein L5 [Enterobacteriaceae endosymbiont of Donacia semicuprea]|uniref:50S ribosomal protein L5 n=1 Tax=Enterobacteriaceae endosymbiont of Donacia semicuprea TaxID=2675783 RepID=UPI0014498C7C|nr:50S ribosomal protein L5 [Enterobacteriaceae endosymbiont of Donacia semicuprea]QJC32927.1 50S ribosomal protein L5 [Enterobacteriaceae endosymbiont of Donacia semicuprea]
MSKLYNYYKNKIVKKLILDFKYNSIMQVPCIKKITLNMGVGKVILDKKHLNNAINDLTVISGQKPIITKSHKSISGFKIRKGYPIGCKVTLRKKRMWDFFERLLWIAIPRIRDFRGLSKKSFDKNGNYNIGIKEQIIFPEINFDKIDHIRGLDIAITTNKTSIKESYALFKEFNFPFRT